ncbi:MAG: VWA domain-containing protein [Ruminococcus flavefaciens]|nr:VWA domain-containing protein [Ruminococcus flavefaciens]MCM1229873.1 VWA domain-containing protein [Ruminococcus flavefaciens]
MNDISQTAINRWRLILGQFSENQLQFGGSTAEIGRLCDMEQLLDYLYSRAQGQDVRSDNRKGGTGDSVLNTAEWITKVRTLFPSETAEILEKHALEKFDMTELLADKEVLEHMTPDMNLLKTVLQLKHLMHGDVLKSAEKIAELVARQLAEKIEKDIKRTVSGRLDRNNSGRVRSARNLDFKKTIRHNLKNFDRESNQLILKDIYFSDRIRKYNNKRIILAVDESGSMLGSVIYSAVMAQIFSRLPFAEIRLVIFDTSVVDLTGQADNPAQVLMSVQLGGGTDIGKALAYCEQQISEPSKTCVIVVTDLFEGASEKRLLNISKNIIESGAKLNFLTALDENANPSYDRNLGQKLADMGAFVGAMTPEQLGGYICRMVM